HERQENPRRDVRQGRQVYRRGTGRGDAAGQGQEGQVRRRRAEVRTATVRERGCPCSLTVVALTHSERLGLPGFEPGTKGLCLPPRLSPPGVPLFVVWT